jgi:hypothetical protein
VEWRDKGKADYDLWTDDDDGFVRGKIPLCCWFGKELDGNILLIYAS